MNEFEIKNGELVAYHGHKKHVIVPSGIESVQDFAFYGSNDLESVTFLDGVMRIGNLAFYQCAKLKEVILPDSIQAIGGNAFARCSALEKVRLPQNLQTISRSLFYFCTSLKEVTLPLTLRHIEHNAFASCPSLSAIDLPDEVRQIDHEAFRDCTSLKHVTLNQKLEKLGDKVFFNCPQLEKLILPESLQTFGEACLQTGGTLTLISHGMAKLIGKYFDEFYNYNALNPREHVYELVNSFIPSLDYDQFKPASRNILLINFLETYPDHPASSRAIYEPHIASHHDDILERLVKEERFTALNHGLEAGLIQPSWLEPYFDRITDREEKAKLLSYQKQDTLAAFEDDLSNLF